MQIKVAYDAQNKVEHVEVLKDDRWLHLQKVGEALAPVETKK